MEKEFLGNTNFNISSQTVTESCPSNIALIKYWGKYENQIPANPSISYTLNHCRTNTTMEFSAGENFLYKHFWPEMKSKSLQRKLKNTLKILNSIYHGF